MGGEGARVGRRARRWIALLIAFVFTLTGISTSTPARAATCSRTWALGAGSFGDAQFGDPASWIEKVAPDSGSNVCFLAGDVSFFNLKRSIETIDVAVGATFTLIGGSLDLTSSTSLGGVFVANGGVVNLGKDSTVPSGRTSGAGAGQSGTFATSTGAVLTIEGVFQRAGNNALFLDLDVVNNGQATTAGTLSIAAGRTFTNNGTFTVSPVGTLTGINQPRFQNNGLVEFTGGTGGADAAGVRGLEFDNDGTVRVLSGDVALVMTGAGSGDWEIGTQGSGSCAAPIGAAPGPSARLFFRPTPTITMTDGSVTGPGCANVFNGTLEAGDGVVWSTDATEIFGATLRVVGDRTLPQLRFGNGGKLEIVGGTATMAGPISQTSPGQYMRFGGDGRLVVPSTQSVVHVGGNGFEVADSLDFEIDGPLSITAAIILNNTASLVSTGTWTVGPTSSFSPAAGTTLRNEGTLIVDAGTGSIMLGGGAGIANTGTLRLARGMLDMRMPLPQLSGGVLTGGRIEIADGANWIFFPLLTSLVGELRVEGNGHFDTSFGSTSDALRDLTTIQPGGALELAGGADLDLTAGTANGLTNSGRLEIGAGSTLTVGDYLQSSGGTLAVEVGSAAHGAITATSASLGGTLEISPVTVGQPPVAGVVILDAATVTGAFADVTAPGGGVATVAGGGGPLSVDFDAAPEPPVPALVVTTSASVTEGTGAGATNQQVLVTIENPNSVPLPIAWSAVGVAAVLDSGAATRDAVVPSGAITLAPGINVVSVPFSTIADGLAESDETFQIVWTPGAPATVVTIVDDDDPPPTLTFGPASFVEASGGGSIQITRNSAKAPLSVSIDSIDGSALANTDYAPLASTVTFAAGQLVANASVTIVDDDVDEPDETFDLSFANGAFTATVTIVDDDEPDNPDDPLPFTLSVEDVTVSEGQTVTLEILVRPPRVGGTGMVELPVELRDGTAVRGLDYFEANGTDGTISVPAAGGTAFAFAFTGDLEDRFEVTEYFDVVFGRAEVPGEQVVARVTIEDNDPFPRVTITSNTPYAEDARLVSLNVRLDRAAGSPLEFLMESVDGSAEDGVDFITFPNIPVRIPAGATEGNLDRVLILDDTEAFEADHEFFGIQAFWSGELVALEEVEIIDNDDGPQARFTRRPSDPVHRVVARDLVEGDTSDATLPLQVELMGDPITAPVVVTVTADSLLADDSDYSVSPTQLTFLPGEGPKTVTVTSRGDTVLEDDETVLLSVQTEFGNSLGRPDDEAHITIVDDDQSLTLTPVMASSASEGATVTVTVVADHAPGEFVTIPVTVTGVTATVPGPGEPGDVSIEGIPETLTIAPDATSASFQIPVVDDEVPEPDEVVGVQFGLPNQGRLTVREKQFTIIDDDPVPFDLSVEDVTVSEGHTVMLELLATPTGPGGSEAVQLPVELRDVTAQLNDDYAAASGTDGTITIPAGGGTVTAFAFTGDLENRFEVTEFFDVVFGRAGVPGEQVTARVTIEDDDPFPRVTITSNSPYGEDAGVVSLNVRLDRAAGSPLGFLIEPVDGTAEEGADFTTFPLTTVSIPAGATEGNLYRLTIVDDTEAFEADHEFFGVQAFRSGELVAFEEVEIIDNDDGPQARFVRGVADPARAVLTRNLVEGNTVDSTLPLLVELVGDPITEPTTVNVVADSLLADDSDYSVSPAQLTFNPGDGPKAVTFTSRGDAAVEFDETVFLAIQTEFGNSLGRPDDEAHITIVDDDDETPAATAVAQFNSGWTGLQAALQDWLAQFDLAPADAPPVVTPALAEHFGLEQLDDDLALPAMDPANDTLSDLCTDLLALGFTLDFMIGGLCGQASPTVPGDVIRARYTTTLADLAEVAGFAADPFNDDTDDVLQSLASSLGLDADGGWIGELDVTLVVGVDGNGFYVDGATALELGVGGSVGIGGSGTVAGTATAITGSADADLVVTLSPGAGRQRNLATLLEPTIEGSASMALSFTSGPLDLGWTGEWSAATAGVTTGLQELTGTLRLPGFTDNGADAALTVVATLEGGVWHVTATGEANADYLLAGFQAGSLSFTGDIGPGVLHGSGALTLTAPIPGGDQVITVAVDFDRVHVTVDGRVDLPQLSVGAPELLRLVDAFVAVHFTAGLPGGPIDGGVDIGAASALVLPADPVATATEVLGSITPNGRLDVTAATGSASIAGGAIQVALLDAAFALGPGSGPNLFEIASTHGTFPALDELGVTFTGLFLTKAGVFGATSVDVGSQGLAESVGLGGVLPFDVTDVTVVFPDPTDLDSFEVAVVGRFDFTQFPDLGPGFTPRVGLGGPVVTPDSPPNENSFSFSVDVDSLADGIIRPLDVGPLTLGFDGLRAADHTIGADLTLGGFVDGEFQSEIGGSLSVDGPAGSILDDVSLELDGSITPGPTTVVDVSGRLVLSGSLGLLAITDLDLEAGVAIALGPTGLSFAPRLDGLTVGEVAFPFGDFMTLRAAGVELDLDPPAGGNYLTIPAQGGLSVEFDESFDALAGWSGTFANLAIGDDFLPKLLPGFSFDITVPPGMTFGLPDFIPLTVRGVGISFPTITAAPPGGVSLTTDLLAGMRIRVSGGITANATWPISAEVDGLEVDLGALTSGEFPITNLDGVSFGVEPFELPGGVVIGGGLELRTIDVDGTTVFYGRVFGDFAVADIGGGADLVVTQYGPVLLKVRAPLGIPLGPSGIVLAGAEGAAQFGAVGIPVPPVGDPIALLNNFTLPTDLTITDQVIADAVRPAVQAAEYTWDQGFALSIAGDVVVAAAPGVLKGRATIGMNLGLPDGPSDPPGLQLVGKGEVTGFGIHLGEVGILVDFANPVEPSFDLAFASPVPGSPIALVVPAHATFGVQLRTDGVMLGTIEGMRVFAQRLIAGSLATGNDLFDAVLVELATRLDDERFRPLAQLLLDVDGDGVVEPAEASRTITATFGLDRVVGRNGLPALLPATVGDATFGRAARAATAFLNELLLVSGEVLADPATFGAFAIDPAAGGPGFAGLSGAAGDALAAIAGVVSNATVAALQAFGDRFNPSFAMEGSLQPTFFGLPIGSTVAGGELFIDRNGLFFAVEGSLVELGQTAVGQIFPVVAPAVNAAITAATLGISDHIEIGARLPFGGIVDSLLGGNDLPTFQPLDPNWAVTISGGLDVLGFEAADLSGIAFLPGQQSFVDSRVQKLFALPPGTPVDPNRIPITSQAHYDALLQYGGILVTASLRVPRLITDPVTQLAAFPPPPDNPLEYLAWLDDLAATATQTDTPARVQWFVPGIAAVGSDAAAVEWASSLYLEGVWDGDLLGLDLGQARLALTPAGLAVSGELPLVGVTGTATINTALLSGGGELPSAGLELDVDTARIVGTLASLGVPSALAPPIGATGQLRAFTPGFDPGSSDVLERNGGIELSARLNAPGLIEDTGFALALTPRPGGFDVHGSAFANRIGPIGGVTITNAAITVDVVGGAATVTIDGSADVLGAVATVHGVLASDLTGQLEITFASGNMNLAGIAISGGATMTLTRVAGQIAGSLGVVGRATLPTWLADAANVATLAIAACVDTSGDAELALAMPAMAFGPNKLVRIGRNPAQVALPPSPAGCQLPAGAPGQSTTGPLFRLRLANGVATAVLDGSLQFTGAGASVAGLSARGSLNSATGSGQLVVSFSGGSMALSGFSVTGSATATIAPGAFSMDVRGTLDIGSILNGARVSGTTTENGITHLGLSVTSLNLSPLTVSSFTVALDRTAASTYRLSVGANVSFSGIGAIVVNGALDSSGNGSLAVTTSNLTIGGAAISNGSFAVVRNGATTTLSASGRFTLFGVGLEVPQAALTLSTAGGQPAISGTLTIRPFGGGVLALGGWTIGGTLRMTFTGLSSRITVDNGTLGIPGWGSVVVSASISVPVANGSFFELVMPAGGLRLGGSPSPFFVAGTFRLTFNNNVAALSATNPSLSWKDGPTTIATFGGPSVVIRSDGFVSAALTGFSATLGGFAFTVPSVSLLIDPAGLNARLALGAGSVTIPGFAAFVTPAFTIATATTFSRTLVADELDLGLIALHGQLVFERQQGVFRLRFADTTNGDAPFLEIEGLVDVPLPTFNIASNGTFEIDAAFPKLGPAGFQIVGAAVHLEKDGPALTDLAGRITGGQLLVANSDPLALPTLEFDHDSRFDETKTFAAWDLGPFLRASSIQVRLRQLSTGVIQLSVLNDPVISAFAGSANMKITALTVASDGTFTGTITGQLALFGTRLAQATFDVGKVGNAIRLTLPSTHRASLDFGFMQASLFGFADSSGAFDFNGSTSVALGVTGFSFSGSLSVQVSSADGIEGGFSGEVCIIACASTSGSLRSDGRIAGSLRIDLNGDGDANDFGEVNAAWFVYLATGGVRVDLNRDGDFEDLGDVSIGSSTGGDATDPAMTTPPNITVNANIGAAGTVRVYYTLPTATDAGQTLTVNCTPAPGSSFPVGATTVTCRATDRANNTRTRTFTVTVVANAAATVPTATNGATVTVDAPGFQPNSLVFVRFQSDPLYVGVFRADADGRVVIDLEVPAGLPPGSHDIVVEGIGPQGGVWQYVQAFEIPSGGPTPVTPPVTPSGPVGRLPATGGDGGMLPLVPLGTLAAALGVVLLFVTRRRTRA